MAEESAALWYSSEDGLSLFCRRFDGPTRRAPVLCLHDAAQDSHEFDALARVLSGGRRVLLPDLRGHGRSDYSIDLSAYSVGVLASDVNALLDIERIDLVVIIGNGIGGLVALELAARRAEALSALVLCDASPGLSAAEIQAWIARKMLAWSSGEPAAPHDLLAPPALVDSLRSLDLWRAFDTVAAKPMLLLRGADSDVIAGDDVKRMREHKPDLDVASIEPAPGTALLATPKAIERIRGFIANAP